ncbi:MAG: tRNA (adenosine(37)-N6)-threonylcarbamoyltransferase complex ATPase subunit type 1 TsaE [Phycisphaerales bacterium]|nr:tRNA (adenosine(37)-N6)-threonylcarbamoyltransferase complex ATPase subunit type 1 TsaE [Phycisphaerales bacterium]
MLTRDVLFDSRSAALTAALGESIGRMLRGGELLALHGALGAGKTQFAKGLARGLEAPGDEPVVSPTFVIVREYAGRVPFLHADAYRLTGPEWTALGLDERLAQGAVLAVEWWERVADDSPLRPEVEVTLDLPPDSDDENARRVTVRGRPEWIERWLAASAEIVDRLARPG